MTSKKMLFGLIIVVLLAAVSLLFSFSIFTNSGGYYRKYADFNIPFVYKLNDSTPLDYIPAIDAGAQVWEDVVSSYWEFENGGFSTANSSTYDLVNLVFFDIQGVNFAVGTNVIAFSRTWTTGSGANYRAVESDLVWNARDFPPSPTGAPGQQDLQSVIAHELGHHLGLGHAGPEGGPPGVGPLIPAATMYGYSSSGDTTKRSLHVDDIAGVSAIYPVWKLQGTVTNASTLQPFPGVAIYADTIFGAELSAPIFANDVWQRAGYYRDTLTVATNGSYEAIILVQNFTLTAAYFGYQDQSTAVTYNAAGGIGQTQVQTVDFQLSLSPLAQLAGTLTDSLTGLPVNSRILISATSPKPGVPAGNMVDTVTAANGEFEVMLPAEESYRIRILPGPPYVERTMEVGNLPVNGVLLTIPLQVADVFVVNDDVSNTFESYITGSLVKNQMKYAIWRTLEGGIPDSAVFASFPSPRYLIWYTGNAADSVLTREEQAALAGFLDSGGRLLLTGQNILEKSSSTLLLGNYLGAAYDGTVSSPVASGVPNDPIGNGLVVSTVGGAGNQTSRDKMTLSGNALPVINYGTTTPLGIAAARVENGNQNWKAVLLGFGLEGVNNTTGIRDTLVQRIFRWFDVLTGMGDDPGSISSQIGSFYLHHNYPNPFNSSTRISYEISGPSDVSLEIFNVLGQRIKILVKEPQLRGGYDVHWDGRDAQGREVPSGVYLYRLTTPSWTAARKMLYVR